MPAARAARTPMLVSSMTTHLQPQHALQTRLACENTCVLESGRELGERSTSRPCTEHATVMQFDAASCIAGSTSAPRNLLIVSEQDLENAAEYLEFLYLYGSYWAVPCRVHSKGYSTQLVDCGVWLLACHHIPCEYSHDLHA